MTARISGRVRRSRPALVAHVVVLALVSTLGLGTALRPAPAGAATTAGYLALGDSIAFGFRPSAVTPVALYDDPANFVGYPEVLAGRRVGLAPLVNASCPGETTASLTTPDAVSNGCENTPTSVWGFRDVHPLHVAYAGTQLAYAVERLRAHPETSLVTLGVGLNDLVVCQATTGDGCTGATLTALTAQVRSGVAGILRTLRRDAGYTHRLVVVTYYAKDYRDAAANAGLEALNAALVAAAKASSARVADGYAAFRTASAAYGGDACAAGLLLRLPDGSCDRHPTAAGAAVLATTVQKALG